MWLMYLAYCEAAFDERHINLVQFALTRPNEGGLNMEYINEADDVNVFSENKVLELMLVLTALLFRF